MLPTESAEVKQITNESQFFIDRMFKEVMRVVLDNAWVMAYDSEKIT